MSYSGRCAQCGRLRSWAPASGSCLPTMAASGAKASIVPPFRISVDEGHIAHSPCRHASSCSSASWAILGASESPQHGEIGEVHVRGALRDCCRRLSETLDIQEDASLHVWACRSHQHGELGAYQAPRHSGVHGLGRLSRKFPLRRLRVLDNRKPGPSRGSTCETSVRLTNLILRGPLRSRSSLSAAGRFVAHAELLRFSDVQCLATGHTDGGDGSLGDSGESKNR